MSSDVSEAVFLLESLAKELAEDGQAWKTEVYDDLLASATTSSSLYAAPPAEPARQSHRKARRLPQDRVSFQKAQCLKTKPCQFFLQNRCARGASCTFAHNSAELRFKPDLTKTKICSLWAAGKCRLNPCNYAHGWHELRPLEH